MSSPRYAIYLAPPPETPLWAFGSRVLGYDAALGHDVFGFAPQGLTVAQWREMTARPRVYGFHATLKAPFHLAAGRSEPELCHAFEAFCRNRAPFDLGPLAVEALASADGSGFAALTPQRASPDLAALEHDAVRAFDGFRAPPSAQELARRQPDTLSVRQCQSLLQFGYPHIGPDYRFHMTLSGVVPDVAVLADRLAVAMAQSFETEPSAAGIEAADPASLRVDALALFRQEAAGARFRVHRCFAFQAGAPLTTARAKA